MTLRWETKWEDAWIGAFWKKGPVQIDLWVCLAPCFPLHFTWPRKTGLENGERVTDTETRQTSDRTA